MHFIVLFLLALLSSTVVQEALASECRADTKATGGPLVGAQYSGGVHVGGLSVGHAVLQMRGLLIEKGLNILATDEAAGTVLAETKSTMWVRAIPWLFTATQDGSSVDLLLTIKTAKGQATKESAMFDAICDVLDKVYGGEEGRSVSAVQRVPARPADDPLKDAVAFSREIALEAQENALAVTARHRGRQYTLRGRVGYIQNDGDAYSVSFDIPEWNQIGLPLDSPGAHAGRVRIACLFSAEHAAQVLALRRGNQIIVSGQFLRYEDAKNALWLTDCVQR